MPAGNYPGKVYRLACVEVRGGNRADVYQAELAARHTVINLALGGVVDVGLRD